MEYHSVGSDYLQSYLNEYDFRCKRRNKRSIHPRGCFCILEGVGEYKW
jgi:hypothetical protein